METESQPLQRVFVKVRVCGEAEDTASQEWGFLQVWDDEAIVDLLRRRLGKSESDIRSLLKSYDRFPVDMTIKPEVLNFPFVEEELLADSK